MLNLENYQSNGYDSKILDHVINIAKTKNCSKLWCNSRKEKMSFYYKFGLKETTKTYTKSGINFVIMEHNLKS